MIDSDWYAEFNYETRGLYSCFIHEEARINEIYDSVTNLDNGAQFSFYDLKLSEKEIRSISLLDIIHDSNIVVYTSEVNIEEYFYEVIDGKLQQNGEENTVDISTTISKLIARLVSNILSVTNHNNAEIIFKTEKANADNEENDYSKCVYWHIDKSHGEILKNNDNIFNFPISNEIRQKAFIISLSGDPTIYTEVSSQQRDDFFNIANTTEFFYGHNVQANCAERDQINQLFYRQKATMARNGYGSVHIKGYDGAMHAAPTLFNESRIVLLITPI
jgi:hypothetical protein